MATKDFDELVQVDLWGCHRWQRKPNNCGYGSFYGKGAHVVAYERAYGPVPPGHEVDHLCRVRDCVNPDHLEAVTHRENLIRSPRTLASINRAKTVCLRGHPYNEANTYVTPEGHRQCRACRRINDAARRRRRKRSLHLVTRVEVCEQPSLFKGAEAPAEVAAGDKEAGRVA